MVGPDPLRLMSAQNRSFTLSRPGLKPGFFVPLRLRVVDTLTVFAGIPMLVATIAIALVLLHWAKWAGVGVLLKNVFIFGPFAIVVLFVVRWVVVRIGVRTLRFVFLLTGLMTEVEASSFPLHASTGGVDPWPESWQKPRYSQSWPDEDLDLGSERR